MFFWPTTDWYCLVHTRLSISVSCTTCTDGENSNGICCINVWNERPAGELTLLIAPTPSELVTEHVFTCFHDFGPLNAKSSVYELNENVAPTFRNASL